MNMCVMNLLGAIDYTCEIDYTCYQITSVVKCNYYRGIFAGANISKAGASAAAKNV